FFFFQAEDGIRDRNVTGVQTCALPIYHLTPHPDLVLLANGWLSNGRLPEPTAFRDVKYVGVHLALERRNRLDAQTVGRFGTVGRSEERRVGKEGRLRGSAEQVEENRGG